MAKYNQLTSLPFKGLMVNQAGWRNNSCYVCSKVKGQDTCYSAAYMSQTQEQQHFTISEVAADWHELMIPQHNVAIHCPR